MHDAATPAWRRALAHVSDRVAQHGGGPPLEPSMPVTVHFHPDRLVRGADGVTRPLVAHLALDGTYRSQFETGTSNGGLTAHPGGDRWRWESRLFGGAYDGRPAAERPVYGSLDRHQRPVGGSVRFGSCHLRLAPSCAGRLTFCYPDSAWEPTAVGTAEAMPLLAAAAQDDAAGRFDVLDDHVEAHLHGGLDLVRDVDAVVLDPCYRGGEVEEAALRLRESTGTAVVWHGGFRLHADQLALRPGFRGADVVAVGLAVARELTGDGWLDPAVVGRAVAAERWDGQDLKRVWHCLARFGAPGGTWR